jgi:lysophospholipase L1-like esterase
VRVLLVAPALRLDEQTALDLVANWALISDTWLLDAQARFRMVTEELVAAKAVPLLDLEPVIAPQERAWMVDAFHFTDAGAAVAAAAVAERLEVLLGEGGRDGS